jgi:hypothetical protein
MTKTPKSRRPAIPPGHWTKNKNNCHMKALKYGTRSEFQKKSHSAYIAASTNGWLLAHDSYA